MIKKPEYFNDEKKDILSHPKVVKNYALLQEIGVFDYISSMEGEVKKLKSLLTSTLDIFARTTVGEIMDATVWRISDYSLPSVIVFLWKPLHNRDEIVIKAYRNYKPVASNLEIKSINDFEAFFQKYPRPVNYELFSFEFSQSGQSEALKSFDNINPELVIPIMGPSGLYGMVLMGNKILGEEYSIAELSFIQQLMSFVSLAIQNNLHYERTLRDLKTGLYNNGFFMTRLNEEIARTRRNGSKSSVIIIDIDFFKKVNDTYGHLAGDRVLETLAITIKQTIRTDDIPSRFGGEEFTVLMPDTDKHSAYIAAERLRNTVAKMKVAWEPPLLPVTISIGICTFEQDSNLSPDEVIQRADEALYRSKKRGRNRSSAWGAGLLDKVEQHLSAGL